MGSSPIRMLKDEIDFVTTLQGRSGSPHSVRSRRSEAQSFPEWSHTENWTGCSLCPGTAAHLGLGSSLSAWPGHEEPGWRERPRGDPAGRRRRLLLPLRSLQLVLRQEKLEVTLAEPDTSRTTEEKQTQVQCQHEGLHNTSLWVFTPRRSGLGSKPL